MNRYRLRIEKIPKIERIAPRWYRRRLGRLARGVMLALGLIVIPTVTVWAWTNYATGMAHFDPSVSFQRVPEVTTLDMSAENLDCRVLAGPGSPAILTGGDMFFTNGDNGFVCWFDPYTGTGANETSVLQMSLDPVNEQDDVAISVSFDTYDTVLESCWNVSDNGPVVVPAGIGQVGPPLILTLTGDEVKTFSCAGTSIVFSTQLTIAEAP